MQNRDSYSHSVGLGGALLQVHERHTRPAADPAQSRHRAKIGEAAHSSAYMQWRALQRMRRVQHQRALLTATSHGDGMRTPAPRARVAPLDVPAAVVAGAESAQVLTAATAAVVAAPAGHAGPDADGASFVADAADVRASLGRCWAESRLALLARSWLRGLSALGSVETK